VKNRDNDMFEFKTFPNTMVYLQGFHPVDVLRVALHNGHPTAMLVAATESGSESIENWVHENNLGQDEDLGIDMSRKMILREYTNEGEPSGSTYFEGLVPTFVNPLPAGLYSTIDEPFYEVGLAYVDENHVDDFDDVSDLDGLFDDPSPEKASNDPTPSEAARDAFDRLLDAMGAFIADVNTSYQNGETVFEEAVALDSFVGLSEAMLDYSEKSEAHLEDSVIEEFGITALEDFKALFGIGY
jgi:hypothetical protein